MNSDCPEDKPDMDDEDEKPEEKLGWYYRHWQKMGLDKETTQTYSLVDWNEQCANDPLFNKELQPPKVKR